MPQREDLDAPISRREFDQRITALERLLEARAEGIEKARDKDAIEIQRRLGELNHAHEQAKEAASQTVPRETFDNKVGELEKWRTEVSETLSSFSGGLTLLRFIGLAGLLAFLLQLLHLSGVTK